MIHNGNFFIITDVMEAFSKHINAHQVSAYNFSKGIERKAFAFFRKMLRNGGPNYMGKITPGLIAEYKEEIINTPIVHYTDVTLNVSDIVRVVANILKENYTKKHL